MEIAVSALVGELAYRSISLVVDKVREQLEPPVVTEESLQRKLLRVRVVVEEAEGRQITSHAILHQVKMLREAMHRGHYVLDRSRYRNKDNHDEQSSFAQSIFSRAKRVRLCDCDELRHELRHVELAVADVGELAALLRGCPRLRRQPYSTHLLVERCMFGRHAEMERAVGFLLQDGTSSPAAGLDVLPVLGPLKAGKSTLLEHVCSDERIRGAFSRIVLLTDNDLKDGIGSCSSVEDSGCGITKHQVQRSGKEKILVVVELDGDIDETTWRKLRSAYEIYGADGCKIIVSSCSDDTARFGTTRPLRVQYLSPEAYWYFFKALAFGSSDPDEEPRLASIAMEMAEHLNGSFIAGNIVSSMLRANFSARFWHRALSCVREFRERCPYMLGAHPVSPWQVTRQARLRKLDGTGEYCLVYNDYQIVTDQHEAPMIKMQDVLSGSVTQPDGKFEALAWKSPVPPHYSYVFSCKMQRPQRVVVRKRHIQKSNR